MKMKSVCERTGLTDRTVRYYIEEGLLSPAFIENHTGRRNFDFTENDIEKLTDISVLRKFGFSISEIHTMFSSPENISSIVEDLKQRKKEEIENQQKLLDALSCVDANSDSVSKLASKLKAPAVKLPIPKEDMRWSIMAVTIFNRKRLIALTDAAECALIKSRLKKADIPYFFKTTTSTGFWGHRASMGAAMKGYSGGVSHNDMTRQSYVYYFYVNRKDYEKAKSVMGKI